MQREFPLFQSHLDLAHTYWKRVLEKGGWAIDATCGNGQDTLQLARTLSLNQEKSGIIAIDVQPEAIQATTTLIETSLNKEVRPPIHYFCQSHVDFPELADKQKILLIVYNLGYLPKGNKGLTTTTETTLKSVHQALELLSPGGVLSITCYPGHPEGAREERALLEELAQLPPKMWSLCHHRFLNRTQSPSLLIIQNNSS